MTQEKNCQMSLSSHSGLILGLVDFQRPDWLLVWKALLGLFAFDFLGLGQNFARMHRYVSRWQTADRIAAEHMVDRVCMSVNHACVWYPKRVLCLQRSVVTTCLLRHYGVPAKMVIGAQCLPVKAHAWTEVEGHPINERNDVQKAYAVLTCY